MTDMLSNKRSRFVDQPIFLVGAERSGTTMLRLMLNNHPNIAWCSEFEYAVEFMTDDGKCYPNLNEFYRHLENNRIFNLHGFIINRQLSYPELIDNFLYQRQQQENKPLVGATCHRNFHYLLKIWPDARFIHIVRDPRDVARSCIGMGWNGNVWCGSERWIEVEKLWESFRSTLSSDRFIEISYEDFLENTQENLERICHFIGTEVSSSMYNYVNTTDYGLPDFKFAYQWKRKASNRDIQLVEARTSSLLVERGYELSNLEPLKITPLLRWKLGLNDKLMQWRFRIQRYGLSLVLSEFLTRRLKLNFWRKSICMKMNTIENYHCKFDGNQRNLAAIRKRSHQRNQLKT
ncbi:MAG: sulfotransferase [Cyanobacteria bacterium P01_D01_bin.50]